MPYVTPNSTVKLISSMRFDRTYKNVIYFGNNNEQYTYFNTYARLTFNNLSYVRDNVIRVEAQPSQVYECNYMMFQNTSFGEKWFYAFITDYRYINNNCVELTYDIDVMQTWFFDCELLNCFVEREHSTTDNVGDNLQPEPIEIGEYVCTFTNKAGVSNNPCVVLAASSSILEGQPSGMMSGVYQGVFYYITNGVSDSAVTELTNLLNQIVTNNQIDSVVAIFMASKDYFTESQYSTTYNAGGRPAYLGGNYIPRNKKLFTYPYTYLLVNNASGANAAYKFEFFRDSTGNITDAQFRLNGSVSCNPTVTMQPQNYKNVANGINEMLVIDDFPQCSYAVDSYKAWLAQNVGKYGMQLFANILTGAWQNLNYSSVANYDQGADLSRELAYNNQMQNITNVATNSASQAINSYTEASRALPVQGCASGSAMFAIGALDFWFYKMVLSEEYARKADEYLDMYGYATNEVKTPNISSRPHWNYVKTRDCNLIARCPESAANKIRSIFNNGVTFWRRGNEIGNYSLDNSPE